MTTLRQETIQQWIDISSPERLDLHRWPPLPHDPVAHILQLTRMGQATLAADYLLFPEESGWLSKTVSGVLRNLHILFTTSNPSAERTKERSKEKVHLRQYAYETLVEMVLNLYGLESRWLLEEGKSGVVPYLLAALEEWEGIEQKEGEISIAAGVITRWLERMKRVQKGGSMVAKTAFRIEEGLDFKQPFLPEFLRRAETHIRGNIYYRMVKEEKCKFGNDYALGLRWLRHLGFEQVSTNPVLAAKAYQDEPGFGKLFLEEVKHHPNVKQWKANPRLHAEEIALFATLLALWDNLYVFRPVFFNLSKTSGGGVVSFQLNPNIAHLVDESVRDVFRVFSLASEHLSIYDRYLLAGHSILGERGRPNLVIKVAATSPAARTITRTINGCGFGSNITVDFSVSQEATLLLEEMAGMADAMRKGILPTQLYMTNMGGRLESHLREVKLESLFRGLKEKLGEAKATQTLSALSRANRTEDWVSKSKTYEGKVVAATRYGHGQKRIDEPLFEALKEVASVETLRSWEEAISKSGTLVARKVWSLFFSETNRGKWIDHLVVKKGITREQATCIMERIHYLPASKRKPFDTYWTLSSRNLVHTEFPDHQENVRRTAEEPGFDLEQFTGSISHTFSPESLSWLNQMDDFRKAYEINPELIKIFKEVGISYEENLGGLTPSDWPAFGPVQKTLAEFKSAYDTFQEEMVSLIKRPRPRQKKKR